MYNSFQISRPTAFEHHRVYQVGCACCEKGMHKTGCRPPMDPHDFKTGGAGGVALIALAGLGAAAAFFLFQKSAAASSKKECQLKMEAYAGLHEYLNNQALWTDEPFKEDLANALAESGEYQGDPVTALSALDALPDLQAQLDGTPIGDFNRNYIFAMSGHPDMNDFTYDVLIAQAEGQEPPLENEAANLRAVKACR